MLLIETVIFPDDVHSFPQLRRLAPLNARARDAKLMLSLKTLTKYWALSNLLRSLIVSGVPRPILFFA